MTYFPSIEARRAQVERRAAQRAEARRRAKHRRHLATRRDWARRSTAPRRHRVALARTVAVRATLPDDVRAAYEASPPTVRRLIIEQAVDAATWRVASLPFIETQYAERSA